MEPRHSRKQVARTSCVLSLALASGCSSAAYAASADREVEEVLAGRQAEVIAARKDEVIRPEPEAPAPKPTEPSGDPAAAAPGAPPPTAAPPAPEPIDLARALDIAVQHNRDYQSRRESLYQQGLGYTLTRFNFGPLFTSTISHVSGDAENGIGNQRLTATLGVSQILPTGGRLALNTGAGSTWLQRTPAGNSFDHPLLDSSIGLSLSQPLLRGFGSDVAYEPLTQAERSLIYAIRDFELFREGFTIAIARSFFDLVSQQQTIDNEDKNYRQAVFDRRQAEALRQVDRNTEVDVYRARRREIDAENRLLEVRATIERARDQFKIQLGLPTSQPLAVAKSEPPFETVRLDPTSAVGAARHNRLDLRSQRQQIEDAERAVNIASNALLPALELQLGLDYGGDQDVSFPAALPDRWNATAGLSMVIPLQSKSERNSYRSAEIALAQARRGFEQQLDQVELEIKNQLRSLRSLEQQIDLQQEQTVRERRAVTVTEIRYEAGDLDNRDLLEARQALFDAQNALIELKVNHFIGRLTLLQSLGLLFVDDQGMWQ